MKLKFLNKAKASRLVSGQTVYRCQIMRDRIVSIEQIHLSGSKQIYSFDSGFTAVKVGDWYLDSLVSVGSISTFAKKSHALEFSKLVKEGGFSDKVKIANHHWDECDIWRDEYCDY